MTQIAKPKSDAACIGLCVSAADIGVGSIDQVAYPHPSCPAHGEPHAFQDSGGTHLTHEGLLRRCVCGAYEDEHPNADPKEK